MPELFNQTQNQRLITDLTIPSTLSAKTRGLIGCKNLPSESGLWLKKCAWIHTLFMSIPIDVIYLDRQLRVKKLQEEIPPWRIPAPVLGARSVIELAAGTIQRKNIQLGDQLNVGH